MKSQKGQALVLIALGAVVLFGFAALAIDGSRIFSDKRHAQNAADTAAFAAALAKIKEPIAGNKDAAAESAALARALSNGYNDDNTTNEVEVNIPPVSGQFAGNSEYIQVIIRSKVKTTFARVLGRTEVTNTVEAITRAQGTTTNPSATGAALAAFKEDGTPFLGTGNGTLDVIGSGVFSNSTDPDCPNGAMKLFGTITYTVETGYSSPGAVCPGGATTLNGTTLTASQVPYPPSYNIPAPSFTCSGTGVLVGTEYQPGNYNGLNPSPGNYYTFAPGNYCFNGPVTLNGGNITANNVNFRMNSGAFSTSGNNTFTCNNVIFHSTGGSGISFNGGSVNNCTGITFYMESGGVQWNGNVDNTFTAPTSGVYKGLLVYLPYGNSSSININGNSGSQFTGSIIAVSSEITLNGNGNTNGLHTQILGFEINFNGNGLTKIHYNPNEQYNSPANPTIELAK